MAIQEINKNLLNSSEIWSEFSMFEWKLGLSSEIRRLQKQNK